ncbi:hypothetical protein [Clostridium saudiense]|uniref:hypothetical protein n=1 Tax=Clostridium saudiense TaxID=1414720 RepID=UPI002671DC12|nr:hypothetical protein [Clostridium saudiense]
MNKEEIKNTLIRDYFNYKYVGVAQRLVDVFMAIDESIENQENKEYAEYKAYKEKLNIINITNEVLAGFDVEEITIYEIEEVVNEIKNIR